MPEISGLQIARKIKEQSDYQALPILLVSAIDRLEEEQLLKSKADGIIYKPFDLDDLVAKSCKWLEDYLVTREEETELRKICGM